MKSHRLASLLACAALAAVSFACAIAQPVISAVAAVYRTVKTLALHGFELAAATSEGKSPTVVAFVQAKAFVLRLIKRERPEVSGGWRMCPSI